MKFKFLKLFAAGLMVISSFLLAKSNNQRSRGDLVISNIEALNASAGETTCDQKTEEQCLIVVAPIDSDTPIFGYSKGRLVVTN